MSNITDSTWYVGAQGCIGVVRIDSTDPHSGRQKNYIGLGDGFDEEIDSARIASMGVPFYTPPWAQREIADEAGKRAVSAFYQEVCRRAESKMAQTGRLEGAHYASMVEIMREMGVMNE
jgi:hypothetical protein